MLYYTILQYTILYYTTKEGMTDLTGFILLCWYKYTILLLLQLSYLEQEILTQFLFLFFNLEPVLNWKHWCTTEMIFFFMPTSKDKVCQDLKGSNCCSGVSFSTWLRLRPQARTCHRHISCSMFKYSQCQRRETNIYQHLFRQSFYTCRYLT